MLATPVFCPISVLGAKALAASAIPPCGIPAAMTTSSATVGVSAASLRLKSSRMRCRRFSSAVINTGGAMPVGIFISFIRA